MRRKKDQEPPKLLYRFFWKAKGRAPLTIRLDTIESFTPSYDKGGCKISFGGGQTATVDVSYQVLEHLMRPYIINPEKHIRYPDGATSAIDDSIVPKDGSDSV